MPTPKARLIGLSSPAPGSGKSTVAQYLHAHGFCIMPLASTLKRMIQLFLIEFGLNADDVKRLMTVSKEEPIPACAGVSFRHLCQTLGTEWGRSCVHPDIWLMCWRNAVETKLSKGIDVVVDDVRFLNEANLVREMEGEMWQVNRPYITRSTHHASEGELDEFLFNRRIINDGSLLDLYQQVVMRLRILDVA